MKVQDDSTLRRDPKSNALININNDQYHAARIRKKALKRKMTDLEQIKVDIAEIKTMLINILNERNN